MILKEQTIGNSFIFADSIGDGEIELHVQYTPAECAESAVYGKYGLVSWGSPAIAAECELFYAVILDSKGRELMAMNPNHRLIGFNEKEAIKLIEKFHADSWDIPLRY